MADDADIVHTAKDSTTRMKRAFAIVLIVIWPLLVTGTSFFQGAGLVIALGLGCAIWYYAACMLVRHGRWLQRVVRHLLILVWLAWCLVSLMDVIDYRLTAAVERGVQVVGR